MASLFKGLAFIEGLNSLVIRSADAFHHFFRNRYYRNRRLGMIHAKIMIVDGLWTVVGSTNFDPRSFRINDEVNVAIRSREVAARLARDFAADMANSREMSYERWQHRNVFEKLDETVGVLLERLE